MIACMYSLYYCTDNMVLNRSRADMAREQLLPVHRTLARRYFRIRDRTTSCLQVNAVRSYPGSFTFVLTETELVRFSRPPGPGRGTIARIWDRSIWSYMNVQYDSPPPPPPPLISRFRPASSCVRHPPLRSIGNQQSERRSLQRMSDQNHHARRSEAML